MPASRIGATAAEGASRSHTVGGVPPRRAARVAPQLLRRGMGGAPHIIAEGVALAVPVADGIGTKIRQIIAAKGIAGIGTAGMSGHRSLPAGNHTLCDAAFFGHGILSRHGAAGDQRDEQ